MPKRFESTPRPNPCAGLSGPVIHADRVRYGCPISRLIDRSLCIKDCPSVPWLTFLYDGIGYFRSTPSSPSTPLSSRIPPSLLPPLQQDTARPRIRMERTRSSPGGERGPPPSLRRRAVTASFIKRPFAFSGTVDVVDGRETAEDGGIRAFEEGSKSSWLGLVLSSG